MWQNLRTNPSSHETIRCLRDNLDIVIILIIWDFFYASVSWWFYTGVWVTVSLLKSLVFFLLLGQILMLSFGRSQLVLLFPSSLVPLSILCWLYRVHQLQLISSSLSCSIVCLFFSVLKQGPDTYLLFSLSFSFTLGSAGTAKSNVQLVLFFICNQ